MVIEETSTKFGPNFIMGFWTRTFSLFHWWFLDCFFARFFTEEQKWGFYLIWQGRNNNIFFVMHPSLYRFMLSLTCRDSLNLNLTNSNYLIRISIKYVIFIILVYLQSVLILGQRTHSKVTKQINKVSGDFFRKLSSKQASQKLHGSSRFG